MPYALGRFREPTRLEAEGTVPMAVYGTLRLGERNFEWCQDAVRYVVENVTFAGRIYYVSRRAGYPVARLDEPGRIKGDILFFERNHRELRAVWDMESGAGYEPRLIEAEDSEGNDWQAWGWHYLYQPSGELIESGDWVQDSRR